MVSVGVICQVSAKNRAKTLARWPQVPPFTPPPIWAGSPIKKSASPAPDPPPDVTFTEPGPAVY